MRSETRRWAEEARGEEEGEGEEVGMEDVDGYRVVKSWTVTRVAGQYIAGGLTSRDWSMPVCKRKVSAT